MKEMLPMILSAGSVGFALGIIAGLTVAFIVFRLSQKNKRK